MWKAKLLNLSLALAIALNLWVGYQAINLSSTNRHLEIYMLDVGQGDSFLIRTPEGKYGLVDGGRGSAVAEQLAQVMPFGTRDLEFILATHPDADHIEGLLPVLDSYKVKQILWGKSSSDSGIYASLKAKIQAQNIPNFEIKELDDFKVGCCTDFDILWPRETFNSYHESETNRTSISFILHYGKFRMFMGGDLPMAEELEAIVELKDRDISVLKVGHHGSRTSTSDQFLAETTPEIALISDGQNNSYGHPHREVLDLFSKYNVKIFRTDEMGKVKLETDGEFVDVQALKGVENFRLKL